MNGHLLDETTFRKTRQSGGEIPSKFTIGPHARIDVDAPASTVRCGWNELAFEVPHFPERTDLYIYIYELCVALD